MNSHPTNLPLLSQAEVDALPTGTRVIITWSGGNGPHIYTVDNPTNEMAIVRECWHPIGAVGTYPLTQVSLA